MDNNNYYLNQNQELDFDERLLIYLWENQPEDEPTVDDSNDGELLTIEDQILFATLFY